MDQRERMNDAREALRMFFQGELNRVWTVLPAIVVSFDGQCIAAQPTTAVHILDDSGVTQWLQLSVVRRVPVIFYGTSNLVITVDLKPGDECLLLCSSRCIDAWFQQGWTGSALPNPSATDTHDLSDCFALPAPMSNPKAVPAVSTSSLQIRTRDGATYLEITDLGVVNIVAPQGLNITGNVTITGALSADGDVAITGTVAATGEGTFNGGHTVSAHTHGGVQAGGAETDPPTG